MACSKELEITEQMLPRRKQRTGLFKRRRGNDVAIRPRRLDFSQDQLFDDIADEALAEALMCTEALDAPSTPFNPANEVKPVNSLPKPVMVKKKKVHRFELTAWRRAKLTYTEGDDFCRLAHAAENDGTGIAKSFNISLLQLRNLINSYERLAEAMLIVKDHPTRKVDVMIHLGDKVHARVHSPFVCLNIRIMEHGPSGLYPTKSGIALRMQELLNLSENFPSLEALLDEAGVNTCFHVNTESETNCSHCTPYPLTTNDADYDSY